MAACQRRHLIGALIVTIAGCASASPDAAAMSLAAPHLTAPAPPKLPRFASLRSDKVNLRVGPGRNYPIKWVLTRKLMPVEIVAQFAHWRKVREPEGSEGWIQERLLMPKRHVIITGAVRSLRSRPDAAAALVARAQPGVVADLLVCRGGWCRVKAAGYTGWVRRQAVFGVFPDETVP